jgi:formylglycine-generating enzyme required for sulfatase activity
MEAASVGGRNLPYAWNEKSLKDINGNYLANFNPKWKDSENISNQKSDGQHHFLFNYFNDLEDFDGFSVTAPVNSYSPNNMGLYCMSGNVAEMVSDVDVTKGGSWGDKSDYLQVQVKKQYNGEPSPFVGFRVFMEVLEK